MLKVICLNFLLISLIIIPTAYGEACNNTQVSLENETQFKTLEAIKIKLFLSSHIKHYDAGKHFSDKAPSSIPLKLEENLVKFFTSPIGFKVMGYMLKNNEILEFVKSEKEPLIYEANGNEISYTENVEGWFNKNLAIGIIEGSNLSVMTLDVLLAHEIGHTPIGQGSINIEPINSFISSTQVGGETIMKFNRKKMQENEIRTVHLFENSYRDYKGLPLRYSYFEKNDVLDYIANL